MPKITPVYEDLTIHKNIREEMRVNRAIFLQGGYPMGFLLSLRYNRVAFHLIRNEQTIYCGVKVQKYNKASPYILGKKLSDLPKNPSFREIFKRSYLCSRCENTFLGLYRYERYKKFDGHIPIFRPFFDTIRISLHLKFILEHPYYHGFPVLQKDQLQKARFLTL